MGCGTEHAGLGTEGSGVISRGGGGAEGTWNWWSHLSCGKMSCMELLSSN